LIGLSVNLIGALAGGPASTALRFYSLIARPVVKTAGLRPTRGKGPDRPSAQRLPGCVAGTTNILI